MICLQATHAYVHKLKKCDIYFQILSAILRTTLPILGLFVLI